MIDRTQLTEALDRMAVASTDTPLMEFEITIVDAAREHLAFLLDFPTDEMVSAVADDLAEIPSIPVIALEKVARRQLEAVRRVMIGEDG